MQFAILRCACITVAVAINGCTYIGKTMQLVGFLEQNRDPSTTQIAPHIHVDRQVVMGVNNSLKVRQSDFFSYDTVKKSNYFFYKKPADMARRIDAFEEQIEFYRELVQTESDMAQLEVVEGGNVPWIVFNSNEILASLPRTSPRTSTGSVDPRAAPKIVASPGETLRMNQPNRAMSRLVDSVPGPKTRNARLHDDAVPVEEETPHR